MRSTPTPVAPVNKMKGMPHRSIPLLLTGFIAGPLTNRVGRVRVVIVSQGIGVLVTAAIGILLWTDRLAFWHLAIGLDFFAKPSQLHGS